MYSVLDSILILMVVEVSNYYFISGEKKKAEG